MSRENKVNPGQYTQRGRLTPDEGAQELAKQRALPVVTERTGSGSKAVPKKAAAKKK